MGSYFALTKVLDVQTFFGTQPFAATLQLEFPTHVQCQVFECGGLYDINFAMLLQTNVF